MRALLPLSAFTLAVLGGAICASAQSVQNSADVLLDALVFARYARIDLNAYADDVRVELSALLARAKAYRSQRKPLGTSGLDQMVNDARVRYERLLVASAADADAEARAVEYVNRLKPCYEWEGYHDCPEHEASFARDFLAANPNGPFHDLLPLLAAHRWLCTAEAYDYEKRPNDATRARQAFKDALSLASQSPALVIRRGAEALRARARCFASSQ